MTRESVRPIHLGNLVVDFDRADAWVDDRPCHLTYAELELLLKLAQRAGRLVPREELASIFAHDPASQHSWPLNTHVSRLRSKLRGSQPWVIAAVWKRGYMLREEQPSSELETHVRRSRTYAVQDNQGWGAPLGRPRAR